MPSPGAEGLRPLPAMPLRGALAIALFTGEPVAIPRAAGIAAQLQGRLVHVTERRLAGGSGRVVVLGRWRLRAWRRVVGRQPVRGGAGGGMLGAVPWAGGGVGVGARAGGGFW